MLGSVVGLPAINDTAGVIWAGFIVLVSLLVAPWAFRTTIFGTIFAWDIVSRRKHWWTPKKDCVWAFSACKIGKAPHRAFGKVSRNERGELTDAWGTPYFFHQLSGTEMEIHSAGPDRRMFTGDDLIAR